MCTASHKKPSLYPTSPSREHPTSASSPSHLSRRTRWADACRTRASALTSTVASLITRGDQSSDVCLLCCQADVVLGSRSEVPDQLRRKIDFGPSAGLLMGVALDTTVTYFTGLRTARPAPGPGLGSGALAWPGDGLAEEYHGYANLVPWPCADHSDSPANLAVDSRRSGMAGRQAGQVKFGPRHGYAVDGHGISARMHALSTVWAGLVGWLGGTGISAA